MKYDKEQPELISIADAVQKFSTTINTIFHLACKNKLGVYIHVEEGDVDYSEDILSSYVNEKFAKVLYQGIRQLTVDGYGHSRDLTVKKLDPKKNPDSQIYFIRFVITKNENELHPNKLPKISKRAFYFLNDERSAWDYSKFYLIKSEIEKLVRSGWIRIWKICNSHLGVGIIGIIIGPSLLHDCCKYIWKKILLLYSYFM